MAKTTSKTQGVVKEKRLIDSWKESGLEVVSSHNGTSQGPI